MRLSVGTMITKETKEPDNRVLLGALLIGCIVSFVVRSVCLGGLRSKRFCVISEQRKTEERQGTERDTVLSLPNCMVINRKLF